MIMRYLPVPSKARKTPMQTALYLIFWLFIAALVMFFAALSSAYLVKRGDADWMTIKLPMVFGISTIVAVVCSACGEYAFWQYKRGVFSCVVRGLSFNLALGLLFLTLQWGAWRSLVANNIFLVGHPSGSFIYILSGAHAVHVTGGLLFLLFCLISLRVKRKQMYRFEICRNYWHFLTLLWLYLYIFLYLNK